MLATESFSEMTIKKKYRSLHDDIISDFLIPVLKQAVKYDRSTGFYSSDSLIFTSIGICDLAKRNGKVRILTSPNLNEDDVDAMLKGYEKKEDIVGRAMVREFKYVDIDQNQDRLNLIANLIKNGSMDIKVCVVKSINSTHAMFHPKIGILYDSKGDIITFEGSANESLSGYKLNWEHIRVDKLHDEPDQVLEEVEIFEKLWNNEDKSIETIDIPVAAKSQIINFIKGEVDYDLDTVMKNKPPNKPEKRSSVYFSSPVKEIRDYQLKAVDKWEENGFKGIFNMATGTGKTITALLSLERLYNIHGNGIFTIIICPQRHLVDQWAEDVRRFGVKPIVGYSGSPDKDWLKNFKQAVSIFNRVNNNECLITTISSFSRNNIQKWLDEITGDVALVVDEVHNIGSSKRLEKLNPKIKYRLGLSATVERYRDKSGTEAIRDFFGEECITYSLDEAIGKDLTNYLYYPVFCEMADDEYEKFTSYNETIDAIANDNTFSKSEKEQRIRQEQIKGARLVARIHSKYDALKDLGIKYRDEPHVLVYCGKSKWVEDELETNTQEECLRLVDHAVQILGKNGIGIPVSKFTCEESPEERREIKSEFEQGRTRMLIAISCLDEGVNMPSIKTAIITSSSDNPKEYIQRRGRVLRKSPGKEYAEIYDLVAVPKSLSLLNKNNPKATLELKFLSKEVKRVLEFSRLSSNEEYTKDLLGKITISYGISIDELMHLYQGLPDYEREHGD